MAYSLTYVPEYREDILQFYKGRIAGLNYDIHIMRDENNAAGDTIARMWCLIMEENLI